MEITTRQQAIEAGLSTYYTGKPCKWGHTTQRETVAGGCAGCRANKSTQLKRQRNHPQGNRDFPIGKRVIWRSPLYGVRGGVVVKSGPYHIWIKDHGIRPNIESVQMIRIDWVIG